MKIYISGQITGIQYDDAKEKFYSARQLLLREKSISDEFTFKKVINPLDIKPLFGIKKYWFYMIADVFQLLKCDEIYMLDNWRNSKGAKIELAIAIFSGKRIIFE